MRRGGEKRREGKGRGKEKSGLEEGERREGRRGGGSIPALLFSHFKPGKSTRFFHTALPITSTVTPIPSTSGF